MGKKYKIRHKNLDFILERRVSDMATVSFDKQFIIRDETALKVITKGLSEVNRGKKETSLISIEEEFTRGKSALRNFSSRSKKSYQK